MATAAYEAARAAILAFAGRSEARDVAIICRNTTEAINHLAYRLRLRTRSWSRPWSNTTRTSSRGRVEDGLPIATFIVDGVPHALVAARLSAESGIGVRHGCFCAHPYVTRLLGLRGAQAERFHADARRHDRSRLPGAVRASAGIATTLADVDRLCRAVKRVATAPPPVPYDRDPVTGEWWPAGFRGRLPAGTA